MVKNDIGVVHGVAGEYVVGDEGHVNSALEGAKGAQRIVLGDDQTRPNADGRRNRGGESVRRDELAQHVGRSDCGLPAESHPHCKIQRPIEQIERIRGIGFLAGIRNQKVPGAVDYGVRLTSDGT